MIKKLFLISQDENTGYDTYDSAVVCADSENEARHMNPITGYPITAWETDKFGWCSSPDKVVVIYLGTASPELEIGLVLSSFNAG